MLRKAAFIDRDGVINRNHGYVHRWEDFEFLPGALEAMRLLQQAGYVLVVVTNQSGLARGYYTEAQYQALTRRWLQAAQDQAGVTVAGVYHCPHLPTGTVRELAIECRCRKPGPGLIEQATAELGLDLSASVLFGDAPTDVQAAQAAGVGRCWQVQGDVANADGGGLLTAVMGVLAPA